MKTFGGNSGYVGYSMSKRALNARNEGSYPKTDFKKSILSQHHILIFLKKLALSMCQNGIIHLSTVTEQTSIVGQKMNILIFTYL